MKLERRGHRRNKICHELTIVEAGDGYIGVHCTLFSYIFEIFHKKEVFLVYDDKSAHWTHNRIQMSTLVGCKLRPSRQKLWV